MARRVPVLRQHHVVVACDQVIDQRHDLVAVFDRERAAGAEIVLHIDDDQRLVRHFRLPFPELFSLEGLSHAVRDGKGRTLPPQAAQ
jgi:hypothetical protein